MFELKKIVASRMNANQFPFPHEGDVTLAVQNEMTELAAPWISCFTGYGAHAR